jgi:uncharacterized protein (DUF2147 family)
MQTNLKATSKGFDMRTFILPTIVALLAISPAAAQNGATTSLAGVWVQDDGTATVRIAPCGQSFCGTMIAEKLQPGDPSQLGQTVIRDIRANGKKGWPGKYIADGSSFGTRIKQSSANAMAVKICAFAFACETLRFDRVQ